MERLDPKTRLITGFDTWSQTGTFPKVWTAFVSAAEAFFAQGDLASLFVGVRATTRPGPTAKKEG